MNTKIISQFVNIKDIFFVTSSSLNSSSDVDLYCVTKTTPSSVHILKSNDMWYEIFIDNVVDVKKKLSNIDQICINFLTEMNFIYGDKKVYEKMKDVAIKIRSDYHLPEDRRNKIVYRIKVLSSKIFNPDKNTNSLQRVFLVNSMTYPLIELILEKHNIFPSSPKRWILQLQKNLDKNEFDPVKDFLKSKSTDTEIRELIEKYVGDLKPLHIDKSSNNSTTFII